MANKKSTFFKMVRAPFLSSIISPLLAATLLAFYITGQFEVINFVVVLIMGICLHIATNVYNDIYDTLQGTDKINVNRNEFSGGSGVLVDNPELLPVMYRLARFGLTGCSFVNNYFDISGGSILTDSFNYIVTSFRLFQQILHGRSSQTGLSWPG